MSYVFLSPGWSGKNITRVTYPSRENPMKSAMSKGTLIGNRAQALASGGTLGGYGVTDPTTLSVPTWGPENPSGWVRRPIKGIEIKPDTPAVLQIRKSNGQPIYLFNDLGSRGMVQPGRKRHDQNAEEVGSPKSTFWTDWILRQVSEDRTEKTQIVETFGDSYLYVFGERPRVLKFDGYLLNSQDFNWRAEFWENWDKYMRATKLVENDARCYINFDDIVVEGYPVNAIAIQAADAPNTINFSFSFYVTNYFNTYMAQAGRLQTMRSEGWLINEGVRKGFVNPTRFPKFTASGKYVGDLRFSSDVFAAETIAVRQWAANIRQELINYGTTTDNMVSAFFQQLGAGMLRKMMYTNDFIYMKGGKAAIDIANKYMARAALSGMHKLESWSMEGIANTTSLNITKVSKDPGIAKKMHLFEPVGGGVENPFTNLGGAQEYMVGNTLRWESDTTVMVKLGKQGARLYTNYFLGHLRHLTYTIESKIIAVTGADAGWEPTEINKWAELTRQLLTLGDTRKIADFLAYHVQSGLNAAVAAIGGSSDDPGSQEAEPAGSEIPTSDTDIEESDDTQEQNQADQESGALDAQDGAEGTKGGNGEIDTDAADPQNASE